jgi:RND superfamily putative drug exporter
VCDFASTGADPEPASDVLVAVVFGLAMDCEVSLVTRMREVRELVDDPKASVVTGFAHGAKEVAAAAIIMISVFAGFIVSCDLLVKSLRACHRCSV